MVFSIFNRLGIFTKVLRQVVLSCVNSETVSQTVTLNKIGSEEYYSLNHAIRPVSARARLAADAGEANATLIPDKEWGHKIPQKVIEAG